MIHGILRKKVTVRHSYRKKSMVVELLWSSKAFFARVLQTFNPLRDCYNILTHGVDSVGVRRF